MGRSITCNYHCETELSNGKKLLWGAMAFSKIHPQSKSNAEQLGSQLVKTTVFAQTKTGKKKIEKDYIIIDAWGHVDNYNIGEPVPFYTF